MRKLLRRRPSPAMVVAIIGVVAATSGDAVADGVRAVASAVGKDQVTSRSVKNNSLLLADFKASERSKLKGAAGRPGLAGPQGAPGAKGDPGPQGEQGAAALSKVVRKTAQFTIPTAPQVACPGTAPGTCFLPVTQFNTGAVNCDPGQVPVGGGAAGDDVIVTDVITTLPTATGWSATVSNDDVTMPHAFNVYVLCVPGTLS